MQYDDFLKSKDRTFKGSSITGCDTSRYDLFEFQRDVVDWALDKGRCAIFADTGLGKTRMQVAWADCAQQYTSGIGLIVAPLAVNHATIREAGRIGVSVKRASGPTDIDGAGIYITNYERLESFADVSFDFVVLDESSIIKYHASRTLQTLLEMFVDTPFKLCATATPAPNDWVELGTHAEFLGIRSRSEMLAEFFYHDSGDTKEWIIKGHAQDHFWRWVTSWGLMIRKPSDLGYANDGYDLPPLTEHDVVIDMLMSDDTNMFGESVVVTLGDRRRAKRESMNERVKIVADMVNGDNECWVVWCNLNDESTALVRAIPDAVEIRGSMTPEQKLDVLNGFADGRIRVLVTKASITGMGLNWQHCNRTVFAGIDDSYEKYYQAVRRFWRFGQTQPVDVYRIYTTAEQTVMANLERKHAIANEMFAQLSGAVSLDESSGERYNEYNTSTKMEMPKWV